MKSKHQNRRKDNRIGRIIGGVIERLESRMLLAFGPEGPEFRVNTYTPNYQSSPSVAMDGAGDFVVSWQSLGQDGSGLGIYAQRYPSGTSQLSATSAADTILLRRNGNNLELFRQSPPVGTPAISQGVDAAPSLTLNLLGGDDNIIIDFTGGNPRVLFTEANCGGLAISLPRAIATIPSIFSVLFLRLGLRFPAGSISTTTFPAHQSITRLSGCTSFPQTTKCSISLAGGDMFRHPRPSYITEMPITAARGLSSPGA